MKYPNNHNIIEAKKLVLPIVEGMIQVEKNGGFYLESIKVGHWFNLNSKYKPIYDSAILMVSVALSEEFLFSRLIFKRNKDVYTTLYEELIHLKSFMNSDEIQ